MSAGDPVGFTLDEQLYVVRGDLAVKAEEARPQVSTRLRASLFWLGRQPMTPGREYVLRVGTSKVPARLESIERLIDASTLAASDRPTAIGRHDVAECVLACEQNLTFDLSTLVAETGRFVVIDDYEISGGGIVTESLRDDQAWVREQVVLRNLKWEKSAIAREQRAERYSQRSALVLVTGSADSAKKEIAKALETQLFAQGRFAYYLGIGSVLYGVDADLKSREEDSRLEHRREHLRRFGEVAHLFLDAGMILVATAIELTHADYDLMRTILPKHDVYVVWAGDTVTTDIPFHLRIPSDEPVGEAVSRAKAALQDLGVFFRG